ncbi:hypothetical protein CYMTET_41251 [Cymbomonas tetramitiformis]|uniref:Uncharacterized protein n=1 Tax=Cymbomonas tetramitiformis TaxID=36881 RepID=A0AAE0F258_9CHLO|nr:hypothetical protein CYMTET_41251 [Cymbomonas tetramitiformis]
MDLNLNLKVKVEMDLNLNLKVKMEMDLNLNLKLKMEIHLHLRVEIVLNVHGNHEYVLCLVDHETVGGTVFRTMETYQKQTEYLLQRMSYEPARQMQFQFDKTLLQEVAHNKVSVGGLSVVEGVFTCPQVLVNCEIGYGSMVLTDQTASSYRVCISTTGRVVDEVRIRDMCDGIHSVTDIDTMLLREIADAFSLKENLDGIAIRALADLSCMAVSRCFVHGTAQYPVHVFEDVDFMTAAARLVCADPKVITGSLTESFASIRERQCAGNFTELVIVRNSVTRAEVREISRLRRDGFTKWSNRAHTLGDRRMLIMLTTTADGFAVLRKVGVPCVFLRSNERLPRNGIVDDDSLCKIWTGACAYVCKRMSESDMPKRSTTTWADIRSILWEPSEIGRFGESIGTPVIAEPRIKPNKVIEMLYNIFRLKMFTLENLKGECARVQQQYKKNLCGNDASNRAKMYFSKFLNKKGDILQEILQKGIGQEAKITPPRKLGVPHRGDIRVRMQQEEGASKYQIIKIV